MGPTILIPLSPFPQMQPVRIIPLKIQKTAANALVSWKMTSAALASINRRIKKHLQRKVDLYVERSEVLRKRRAADTAVAEKRKREDEAFKAEVGRANVKAAGGADPACGKVDEGGNVVDG
ncbi:predicted protein [Histoplasma capsulatum G186AR]|uniref:Uncharacterized protein n=1 Tax=Ajellomyces capsulatus (strain G186AR / H82 / ATCC MYA-2454 / RMSCC 2432) TaxID=447093 RepID=C0P012_AJECG|nr:uncharacterized protein HCBG_08742 [Histoplasma capsulatum G186AR]EEH03102.1 predicted protein [Histoplasma capsulatum G186AR]